jgi:hypothetical protein
MELGGGTGEGLAVEITHGVNNHFFSARHESSDVLMRTKNDSADNLFESTYQLDGTETLIDQQGNSAGNVVSAYLNNAMTMTRFTKLVTSEINLGSRAEGTSGTATRIRGSVFGASAGSAATQTGGSAVTYSRTTGEVTLTSAVGVGTFVDTSVVKDFVVTREGSAGGRIVVVCYDSGGTIIHDNDLIDIGSVFSEVSWFGSNAYRTGSDSLAPTYFRVSNNVDHVLVMVAGGTSSAAINSYSIWAQTAIVSSAAYTGFNETDDMEETAANIADVGNAINTAGKYRSKLVWDTTNNRLMRAAGSGTTDAWYVVDGSTSVTPS